MSTWNWVLKDPFVFDDKCVECVRWHIGWNIFIKRERLDRIDKDGKQGIVYVDLEICPTLPLNDARFTFMGSDVCLKHMPIQPSMVTDGKQHRSPSKLEIPGALPPGFLKK